MLILQNILATNYARLMSLDMRLIDEKKYSDHIDNKASHCAAKIAEYYHTYDKEKGTQFVFSDLGTYKPGEWNDGNKKNPLKLDGVESTDIKALAEKLGHIADNATTHGAYLPIGELYGFRLSVKTEDTQKEGIMFRQNRFFVEGGGHVKYDYNNGSIANDPKLAVNYFIHALEKIPTLIENHEKKIQDLSQNIPVLREVAQSTWRKEDELKSLKTEAAALDRKIQLSLKPVDQGEDKPDNKQEQQVLPASQKKEVLSEVQKAFQPLQDLLAGKLSVDEYKRMCDETKNKSVLDNFNHSLSTSQQERQNEYKEEMGGKSGINSISKYDYEKQTKGLKI